MNFYELKAFRWLLREYNLTEKDIKYNYNINPDFVTPVGNFEVKSLNGRSIVFSKKQIDAMQKISKLIVLVFSKKDMPIFQIPFQEIDFKNRKWGDLNIYISNPLSTHTIAISERNHEALITARDIFEADFGKRLSLGEFLEVLAQGYMEGRTVIEKHSQFVDLTVERP